MKAVPGSDMGWVSGNYHENKGPVVMEMAEKSAMFLELLVFVEPLPSNCKTK